MMLLFAFVALVLTIATFWFSIQCLLNFGHGLKDVLSNKGLFKREAYEFHEIPNPMLQGPRLSLE